jgi:hypothetical protein
LSACEIFAGVPGCHFIFWAVFRHAYFPYSQLKPQSLEMLSDRLVVQPEDI